MKRKGSRKSGKSEEGENGIDEAQENGSSEEPKPKKEKKSKAKAKKSKSKHDSEGDDSAEENETKALKSEEEAEVDPLAEADDGDDDAEYEVEAVLDDKMVKGVRHFLIRWKGYTEESDTWEPEDTLECTELIKDFKEKAKKNKKEKEGKEGKKKSDKKKKEVKEEDKWDENEDFEVDKIIDVYFHKDGKRDFLVSWKGYPASENTWEPEDNMDCKDLIKKFMSKVEAARQLDSVETKLRIIRKPVNRLAYSMHENDRRLSRRHRGKERVRYFDAE